MHTFVSHAALLIADRRVGHHYPIVIDIFFDNILKRNTARPVSFRFKQAFRIVRANNDHVQVRALFHALINGISNLFTGGKLIFNVDKFLCLTDEIDQHVAHFLNQLGVSHFRNGPCDSTIGVGKAGFYAVRPAFGQITRVGVRKPNRLDGFFGNAVPAPVCEFGKMFYQLATGHDLYVVKRTIFTVRTVAAWLINFMLAGIPTV